MNDYGKMKALLHEYLEDYKKEAEDEKDPNETAGVTQTGLGKEMTEDAKEDLPEGTAAGESASTEGDSSGESQIVNPPVVHKSDSPEEDEEVLEDKALKKAAAAQIRFELGLMHMIDRAFETEAVKTASDVSTYEDYGLTAKEAAEAWRGVHLQQIMEAFDVGPKTANEMLDQLAEEDPAAVLPPEAFSDEDADDILAAAAEADAEEALDEDYDDYDDYEDGGDVDEVLVGALAEALEDMQDEGLSQEEALATVMEELEIEPEDLMEAVVEDLREQGMEDDEIMEIAELVEELSEDGVTAEELAEILSGDVE